MSLDLEIYIEKLAAELRQASDLKVWEVPMHHRTKDSVSSYRAAVGMVGAVMLKVLRDLKIEPSIAGGSAAQLASTKVETAPAETPTELDVQPESGSIEDAGKPASIFDDEQPRQRRRREGNNAA